VLSLCGSKDKSNDFIRITQTDSRPLKDVTPFLVSPSTCDTSQKLCLESAQKDFRCPVNCSKEQMASIQSVFFGSSVSSLLEKHKRCFERIGLEIYRDASNFCRYKKFS
jgi:hypothetical protein